MIRRRKEVYMSWRTRGHRGDALENTIELSNDYYRLHGYARVDKVSVPITVVKRNDQGQIVKAYFERRSTVDFLGIAQGIFFCFDCKETQGLSLPLANIHDHQLSYMEDIRKQGGVSFFIVHFKKFDEYYLVPYEIAVHYKKKMEAGGRKSIPYSAMKKAIRIGLFMDGLLNYLPSINVYLDYLENDHDYNLDE
jgi:recombination protein U